MAISLRRFTPALIGLAVSSVLLLVLLSLAGPHDPTAAAEGGSAEAAMHSPLRKLMQYGSSLRPASYRPTSYRPSSYGYRPTSYRPTSTFRPTSYRPRPTSYRPRPTSYRPAAAAGAAGAGAGVAGGAAVAANNKPNNPCQLMKDGVAMYNFGAPGCEP